jgi:SAM-dependent methyltransferase
MTQPDWNARYVAGDLPWDTGEPDANLVDLVRRGVITPGRALEVGCGTGTNSIWLAREGFDVLGLDLSPVAVERARSKAEGASARFEVSDFLEGTLPAGPFHFVLDRGCFHVFDDAGVRARFAERVASLLEVGGTWLSLIGSTEGAPREVGPPRRSARDVVAALEPALELVELRSTTFEANLDLEVAPRAWLCLSRRRAVPAQPSTKRG